MRQINSKFGAYYNPKFTEIWGTAEDFLSDYKACDIPQMLDDTAATTLFYLLYARYGNDIIASSDRTRFKYMLFSLIFQYGATWQKRLEIQKGLRELSPEELIVGATQINNHAYNPQTAPSTSTLDELSYINEQHATRTKYSKLDGYARLMALLDEDVTGEFLDRFNTLFIKIAAPQTSLVYNVYRREGYTEDNNEYLEV